MTSEEGLDTDEPKIQLDRALGAVNADLSLGSNASEAKQLLANKNIAFRGITYLGSGFVLDQRTAQEFRRQEGTASIIRPYLSGREVTSRPRGSSIIDFTGWTLDRVRTEHPRLYQHLRETVHDLRQKDRRLSYREKWWQFAEPRTEFRNSVEGSRRYIVTSQTAKHLMFAFIDAAYLPDQTLVAIASDDALMLALLSSAAHGAWCDRLGASLEDRPRYTNSFCFDPFPFPDPSNLLRSKLRHLGEELDATRKRVQAEHPDITLTGLYNVLEKVKTGADLTPQDEDVKTRGLVLVIKDLHDQIDAATAEAYGWPADLSDEQILERLVALNAERAKEEAQGFVRWLRPEYQEPRFGKQAPAQKTGDLDLEDKIVAIDKDLPAFPKDRYEQPLAIEAALAAHAQPLDAAGIAKLFRGKATEARAKRIAEVLTTLARYGRIIALDDGRYVARRVA